MLSRNAIEGLSVLGPSNWKLPVGFMFEMRGTGMPILVTRSLGDNCCSMIGVGATGAAVLPHAPPCPIELPSVL